MALENLFIRSNKSLGGIPLDAIISESHKSTVRKTTNPIELGADITDHVIIDPKQLTILAEVSDTPLGSAALGQIVDLITGLFGEEGLTNLTRSNITFSAILQLQESRKPMEVQTKLKRYKDMIIISVTSIQDKDTSRIVAMSIVLEEIIIVKSTIIKLGASQLEDGSTEEQGSSAEDKGRQEPVSPDSNTERSVIKSILSWVFG